MKKLCYLLVWLICGGFVFSGFYLAGAEMPQSFDLDDGIDETEDFSWLRRLIKEQEAELSLVYEAYVKLTGSYSSSDNNGECEKIIERMRFLGKQYSSSLFSAIFYGDIKSVKHILKKFNFLETGTSPITDELLFTGIGLLEYAIDCLIVRALAIRKRGGDASQQETQLVQSQIKIIYLLRDRLRGEGLEFDSLLDNTLARAIASGELALIEFFVSEVDLFSFGGLHLQLLEDILRAALSASEQRIKQRWLKVVKHLADALVGVNRLNRTDLLQNSTVLHEAIRAGADDIAALVVEYGAQLLALRVEGQTPFELASSVGWHRLRNFSRASSTYLNASEFFEQFPIKDYQQPTDMQSTTSIEASTSLSQRKKKTVRWVDENQESQPGKVFVTVHTFKRESSATETNVAQTQNNQESNASPVAQEELVTDRQPGFNEVNKIGSNSTTQRGSAYIRLSASLKVPPFNFAIGEI